MSESDDGAGHDAPPGAGAESHPAALLRAEHFALALDRPMGILGIVFLFVVLAQLLVTDETVAGVLTVVSWLFWGIFAAEFLLRAFLAHFQLAFWRRNWWQVVFLLVPFLRFFRALQGLRLLHPEQIGRLGAIVAAGVRGTRSAVGLLSNRIGWLVAITAVVILAASQLLYAAGSYTDYGEALYESALTTLTGSGITATDGFARVLHVLLAVYSVALLATLAATVAAYLITRSRNRP